jgi:ribosomal protein L31
MKYAIFSPGAHMPSYATFFNRSLGQNFKCNSYPSKMMVNLEQRLWTSIHPFWKGFNSKVNNFIG